MPLRSEAEEIPTHGKKITPHHVEDRSRQPGSGSLLATLKRDACTHLQSCPKRPMTARAESTSRESHAHSAGQRGTPYSSVLQLLMEGPGSMQQRNTRADGGALSAMRFGMSSYGSRHFVELKPQTPTPGFSAPGFGTDPYTGAGLFCMGSLPSSMDASYRRSARRFAAVYLSSSMAHHLHPPN